MPATIKSQPPEQKSIIHIPAVEFLDAFI